MSRLFVAAPTQREVWTGAGCFSVDLHNDDASPDASLAVARVERGVTTELHRLVGACKRDIVCNDQGILEAVIRRVQRRSGSRTPATAISNSAASARRGAVRRAVSMRKPRDRHSLNALRPTCAASSAGRAIGEQRPDNGIAPVGPTALKSQVVNEYRHPPGAVRRCPGWDLRPLAGAFIRPTQKAVKSDLLPPQAKPYRAAMR
jgi:hypothetical protein